MKQFLVTVAGVFSGLLLFFVGIPLLCVIAIAAASRQPATPAQAVLSLDLRQSLPDQDEGATLPFLNNRPLSTLSVVSTLRRAAHDDAVKGLLIRLPEGGLAPAAADEISTALKAFRATGKPVIAHSQGLYPSGVSTATYMLGAASGDFWMQPGASLQSTGLSNEDTFLKRFFDKYGLQADYQQRYQYKNAVNGYLYDDYTPAHREAELGWMTSIYQTELGAAAKDRKMAPDALTHLVEAGPYGAEQAKALQLIDQVGQVEAAQEALLSKAGPDAKLIDFAQYSATPSRTTAVAGGPAIALIGAEGEIVTGTGSRQAFNSNGAIYSDDVAKAFYNAIHDDQVKAIVFRVSSPGGSDTASEQILSAVAAAKAAHKPVIVSMGAYAASGGYWISSEASEIVAEPTTLTGSIGVFGGKLVLGPALARFGVDLRRLSVGGQFADAYNSGAPFSPAQKAAISSWMDRIYANFTSRVAEGRRLPLEKVQDIAKGRVWTGAQAKELGLVDRLGGIQTAFEEAKRLAKLPAGSQVLVKTMSPKASPLTALSRMIGMGGASLHSLASLMTLLSDPQAQAALQDIARARAQAHGGAMVLAPNLLN